MAKIILILSILMISCNTSKLSKSNIYSDKIIYYINKEVNDIINYYIDSNKHNASLYYISLEEIPDNRGSYRMYIDVDSFDKNQYKDSLGDIVYVLSYLKKNSNRVLDTDKYFLPVIIESYDLTFSYFNENANYQGMSISILRHGFFIEFNRNRVIRIGGM